jgi:hypothetical protein
MARASNLNRRVNPPAGAVQGSIGTLVQGVSQQPPHIRQEGQGEAQLNGWSSPVVGLTKRRPTVFVNKLSSSRIDDFFLETMPVGSGERYNIFISKVGDTAKMSIVNNGKPVSIDVHGGGLSVVDGAVVGLDSSYLWSNRPLQSAFVFFNRGPTGFLLNRSRVTAMKATLSPAAPIVAVVFIQSVAYEVTYRVTVDNYVGQFTTPKATDTNNQLDVDKAAAGLIASLNTSPQFATDFIARSLDGVIEIKRRNGAEFTIQAVDGRSNTLMRHFKGSTSTFTGLPTIAPNGMVLRVENASDTQRDDYWVRFTSRDNVALGEGTWKEAVAPGVPYIISSNSMPLIIYRMASDVFFVGPADGATRTLTVGAVTHTFTFPKWGDREAGDTSSVPTPSFIGSAISDHGIFRGRYVVLAGESIVISRVDEIFNFFQQTSAQVIDTDPIDLTAVSETSSSLYWMLPVEESLLVFGAKSQFQVRPAGSDVLTPRNAVCTRLSNIETNVNLRPKLCGANVVFSTLEHGYTGFREYQFYDTQSRRIGLNIGGNSSITLNVPKYIPGTATLWDVGESVDFFVCKTPSRPSSLFIHKYLWAAPQSQITKLQASWSEWTFDGTIRWARFIDNDLWLVMTYGDGTYTVRVRSEELDAPSRPEFYIDRRLDYPECNAAGIASTAITATYDDLANLTTFTLPYEMAGVTFAVVRWDNDHGQALQIGTAKSGNQIECQEAGDWRNSKLTFGRQYLFKYTFTNAYKPVTDQSRQRVIGDLSGRLQLATWTVNHVNTGRYDVVVKRQNRAKDSRYQFWSRVLNVEGNRLDSGEDLLDTGRFRVPVYAQNTSCSVSIESTSWLPVTISSASWEGSYSNRARSLG